MKTPRYFTQTLAAGAYWTIGAFGRFVNVLTVSASTIQVAIDDDPLQQVTPGMQLEVPESYQRIVFYNAGAVASTVVVYIADRPVTMTSDSLVAAMVASLANIETDIDDYQAATTTPTVLNKTNVADGSVPAAATLLFAANGDRKPVEIVAAEDNGGYVYIGLTNAVTPTVAVAAVLLPGGAWWSQNWKGGVWACGSDALQNVYGNEQEA